MTHDHRRILIPLVAAALALPGPAAAAMEAPLQAVHEDIVADYPTVVHVDAAGFARLEAQDLVVFDVRDREEYGVSRLPGAIRVDLDVDREEFLAQHGSAVAGRVVVFYCSVGRRSSMLAARLQAPLLDHGAAGVANLEGGIFEWHNEARPLVDALGDTRYVHPYDHHWARYVEDDSTLRFEPREPNEEGRRP